VLVLPADQTPDHAHVFRHGRSTTAFLRRNHALKIRRLPLRNIGCAGSISHIARHNPARPQSLWLHIPEHRLTQISCDCAAARAILRHKVFSAPRRS
jgi:hypothetical protein